MVKRIGPGRPPATEVSTEAAKMDIDADRIPTTDPVFREANEILKETSKNKLHEAALYTARKAATIAKAEYQDAKDELTPRENPPMQRFNLGGMTPDDIKKMAEALPENQREPFIRQALGMSPGNPVMNALWNRPKTPEPQPTPGAQPMSFSDIMQGMMGIVTMQMQMNQQKTEEWRTQQEFEEKAHRRRMEELRAASGVPQEPTGPDPVAKAYELQIDLLKESLKDTKELLKEITSKKPESSEGTIVDELRKENLALMQGNFDKEREELHQKINGLEARVSDASRFSLTTEQMLKRVKEETGVDLHAADVGELQVENDHAYRMKQLELKEKREDAAENERLEMLKLQRAEAEKQTELFKQIGIGVGNLLVKKHFEGKDLENSSPSVQTLAGGIK